MGVLPPVNQMQLTPAGLHCGHAQRTRFRADELLRRGPTTSLRSLPAAFPSASSERASSPCSSWCSCLWSPCPVLPVVRMRLSAVAQAVDHNLAAHISLLCASRLRRTHRGDSIFVDLDHIASGVCAASEPFEAFRLLGNDRVGVSAGFDHVTLFDLLVEVRVEPVPTSP